MKNRKRNLLAAFILMETILAGSCMYDKEELLYGSNPPVDCNTTPATFNANVFPLVLSKCAISGCHDRTASGGHIFQNYNNISGAKGDINTQAVIQKTMPPTGPLSQPEINILKCWIEGGGLNN